GIAKNNLTIGAVNGIPGGWNKPGDVVMSSFSSWGPTDDGRIKPDLVADGVSVTSTGGNSTTSYATLSGTSMAAPNTTGSLLLLQ
ncbi:S8 family serine peptidase, partial [Klebsiella pneumoniae]|uniref:S8 family serine peptidase n=1 Tax=Klebsiella pneumoniae TaxID=573 RepID=UPI003B980700